MQKDIFYIDGNILLEHKFINKIGKVLAKSTFFSEILGSLHWTVRANYLNILIC